MFALFQMYLDTYSSAARSCQHNFNMSTYPEIEFQIVDFPSPPSPGPYYELSDGKRKWRRNHVACDACHARRVKCDMASPRPCSRCQRKDIHCDITRQRRKRGRAPRSKTSRECEANDAPRWHIGETHTDEGSSPILLPDLSKDSPTSTPLGFPSEMKEEDLPDLSIQGNPFTETVFESEFGLGLDAADDWLSMAHLSHDWPVPALTESSSPVDLSCSMTDFELSPTPSSPVSSQQGQRGDENSILPLKYPVLNAVMPFLETQISPRLACDLLELYFAVEHSSFERPACQNLQCHILRRASFLGKDFRPTSMPLLTSMLWIAASDDQVFSLSISPSQQRRICQFLGELTKSFLSFSDSFISLSMWNPVHMDKQSRDAREDPFDELDNSRDLESSTSHLDDLMACIHVASILSAEQNTTCKEWWQVAFNIARKLKLNEEIPAALVDKRYIEEHLEERRRTWWLLYIMDRHLALSHNRPLILLDEECENLLLPLDEASWQGGDFQNGDNRQEAAHCYSTQQNRRQNPRHDVFHGSSFFGFLLSLMKITGDIISLDNLRSPDEACEREKAVLTRLESYQISLSTFISSSASQSLDSDTRTKLTEKEIFQHCPAETQTAIAYSSYLIQVLHILLIGKWDWPNLVEQERFFKSSTFTSTKAHILEAAFWLQQILHLDPEARFMPYLFSTQLLQGSFPVLLIIERLQRDSGEDILIACGVMIRAIEACLVTRDEHALRGFRRLFHGAVSQAWGRPLSASEIRGRRKAISMLFLWVRRGSSQSSTDFARSIQDVARREDHSARLTLYAV